MGNVEFRTVYAGVRPARLAILLGTADPHWQQTSSRVMECLSSTWGGCHSIIVPTDGRSIDPHFWDVLEAFDPDYVCPYYKTGLDWKLATPNDFQEALERELSGLYGDGPRTEEQRQHIDDAMAGSQADGFEITPELERELKNRLAPFFFDDSVLTQASFSARTSPGYPLTPLSTVVPNIDHPAKMSLVDCNLEAVPRLWIESITGATFEEHTTNLEQQSIVA
jgi:hypothetical protein